MSNLAGLVSTDSRSPLQRLRRAQLWQIADRAGIVYPPAAPADAVRTLLEANQITGLEAEYNDITRFQPFVQKDENGATHVEHYPVPAKHSTADKVIDYTSAIEERAASSAEDPEPTELDNLRQRNAELEDIINNRLAELEQKADRVAPDFPLQKLLPWQLKHMAKDRGIDYKGLSKEELIAALEG